MSNYQDILEYLFNQFPQYQKIGKKAFKADLTNITSLCKIVGNPQTNLKCIHIAGTNGKGSTAHMLASVLQEAGNKVGIFTSPHMEDFRERIKINGHEISKKTVIEFVKQHKESFKDVNPSFFEWTTVLSFYYFKQQKIDIAIIETGLGGRLDSTNIITPLLSIISTIGKDHENILGNSIEEIAFEKAGIIKENTPTIIGTQITGDALRVIERVAKERKSTLYIADKYGLETDLKGDFQKINTGIVSKTIELLKSSMTISSIHLKKGLLNVSKNTSLRGRWEILDTKPLIIADIGHNVQAFKMIQHELKKYSNKKIYLILGISDDKNIDQMLTFLPKNINYILTKPKTERAIPTSKLKNKMKNFNSILQIPDSNKAFTHAKKQAKENDLIFIGGSAFLVAEILSDFFPS
ncbi:bifunctional folylpolyglutamate synthase/dihydrofolate synthase [Flavobacteriales bacterium]|nr:bifunctional folylpolyglutamate synthase/dihydrofolate synthase [Flavobacteriales bacterium]